MKTNTETPPRATHKSPRSLIAGNACILLATIFWGVNVSFTKALIPQWMSADGIIVVRLVGGCILMWLVSIFLKCERIARHDFVKLALGGAIGLFAFIFLFVTSLKYGNPIDISIIMTLPPVFVILTGIIFQGRRPSWLEYVGIAVSMVGAVIVIIAGQSSEHASDKLLGDILAVCSTVCYAFYLVILEGPTHTYRPVNMLRWVFLFAAIPALFLLPGFDREPLMHTSAVVPWLEIVFILLCPTFLAYFLVHPAIKLAGSEAVSLYQYLLPVFATLSAVLMGLDKLRLEQIIAMAVIIAGMILTNIGAMHRRIPPSD